MMPAKSGRQQRAAGVALAAKRAGKSLPKNTPAGQMQSMSKENLRHFAKKRGKSHK